MNVLFYPDVVPSGSVCGCYRIPHLADMRSHLRAAAQAMSMLERLANSKPKPGCCLIRPRDAVKTQLIVLPETWRRGSFADCRQGFGQVIAVTPNGHEPGFTVGDWAIFDRMSGMDFADGAKDTEEVVCLVRNDDVMAVVI